MQSLWMQCRMFEAISFTANEKKMIPIINAKQEQKTTMKNQVKWQSNDNVTIRLSAHTGSGHIQTHTQKKGKWREKKPKNRIAWCKFVSFTRQLFHCVYACVCLFQMWYNVFIHCSLQLYCFSFHFTFFPVFFFCCCFCFKRAIAITATATDTAYKYLYSLHSLQHSFLSLVFVLMHFFSVVVRIKRMKIVLGMSCVSGSVNTINDIKMIVTWEFSFGFYICVTQVRK